MGTTQDKSKSAEASQLRRRAEDHLSAKATELHMPRSEKDAKRLVHELEVHQIELEMQNAELRQAQEELEILLRKYTDLYDFAPVGYITLAGNGNILAANLTCTGLLGIKRSGLMNRPFQKFVHANDIPSFNTFLDLVFVNQKKATCEVLILHEKGHAFFVHIEAIFFGAGEECLMALIDISERKRAQDELALKIIQLESSLAMVKQLEGIIPICSYCKKIRDDKQSWQQLEKYITEHSEACFSHGICPECAKKNESDFIS